MNLKSKILLLGPPAAGKSTVASQILSQFLHEFTYFNLDDDISTLCKYQETRDFLSDDFIDQAVERLLKRAFQFNKCIIELPHHDYLILMQKQIELSCFDILIIITCPFDKLEYRNNNRANIIPIEYIRRCTISTNLLVDHLKQDTKTKWLLLNSDESKPLELSESIFRFLERNNFN